MAILGGVALALLPAGALSTIMVLIAVLARLACANLDGSLARRRPATRFGAVVNELGDRGADLALLAGLSGHLHGQLAVTLLFASCLPSWVSLAAAAAGDRRRNGGPVGKTERAFLCVVAAAFGWWVIIAVIITVGSVLTAILRVRASAGSMTVQP